MLAADSIRAVSLKIARAKLPSNVLRRIALGINLIALNTLMVELLLTRVFDVILYPNIGYMIITGALFAFGLAGIFATQRPLPAPAAVPGRLRWLTVGLAASLLVIRPGLNTIPFHYDLITEQPGSQLLYFLGMYLLITVPFFLAGLIFAWVVPHPVPWTHICAMPPGVAHTPRALRSAFDTQASQGARFGCTAPRSRPRRRGRPRGSERFGRGSLAP